MLSEKSQGTFCALRKAANSCHPVKNGYSLAGMSEKGPLSMFGIIWWNSECFEDEDEERVLRSYGRRPSPDDTHSLTAGATDENFTFKILNP